MRSSLPKSLKSIHDHSKSIVRLDNIRKTYDGSSYVLDSIHFSIQKGEFSLIEGKSGSGKSTFLNIVGLLEAPTQGSYYLNNALLHSKKINSYSKYRAEKIGFIFQSYQLIEKLSILDNILLPYLYMERKILESTLKEVDELLYRFNLLEMKNKEVSLLSGGEKQRVAIARAIIKDADIIIADEPTGNLDAENSKIVVDQFYELSKKYNKAVIAVTHNPYYFSCADTRYFLKEGKLS